MSDDAKYFRQAMRFHGLKIEDGLVTSNGSVLRLQDVPEYGECDVYSEKTLTRVLARLDREWERGEDDYEPADVDKCTAITPQMLVEWAPDYSDLKQLVRRLGEDDGAEEVARLLTSIGERIPDPLRPTNGKLDLHDANGNHCGTAEIKSR